MFPQLGWNEFFARQLEGLRTPGGLPGRIVNEEKGLYRVWISPELTVHGQVPGRLRFTASGREDFPAVGDWVWCEQTSPERVTITAVFERRSMIARQQTGVGESPEVQIIATNVDWAFIATSANEDLNFARLDRYVTLAWDSGCVPVIVLTKIDLCADPGAALDEIAVRFPGVDICGVSAVDGGVEALEPYLTAGKTCVLIGSSGVGKSTLTNALLGEERLATREIRASDGRGRHTTSSRQMVSLPGGALMIDTPGMRGLAITGDEQSLSNQFGDIEELIEHCRFSDCGHRTEPGCAVLAALADGGLENERWRSFQKLQRELRYYQDRRSKSAQTEKRKEWARINRAQRQARKG